MRSFQPLHEQAYEHIKQMITSHALVPNTIYSETKLAGEIGISRTPVRDALQRLGQEGYIDILPSKGFMLHTLTQTDLAETYHIRCAIEGYCVRMMACSPGRQETLERLEGLLAEQKAALRDAGEAAGFCALDQEFHTAIVAFARSGQFGEIFHNHMHRIYQFALSSFEKPGRMQETIAEHEEMLRRIRSGDADAAYAATLAHMISLKNIMNERL